MRRPPVDNNFAARENSANSWADQPVGRTLSSAQPVLILTDRPPRAIAQKKSHQKILRIMSLSTRKRLAATKWHRMPNMHARERCAENSIYAIEVARPRDCRGRMRLRSAVTENLLAAIMSMPIGVEASARVAE